MKHTKLYGFLFALAMVFMTCASAMAQELTLKKVTFLKQGDTATVAVGLANGDVVNGLQARVSLPEGLTFVAKANNAKRFNINKTDRTEDMTLILNKIDNRTATMVGFGAEVQAGEGDVFTFDVAVADNYAGSSEIALSGVQLNVPGQPVVKPENAVTKVIEETDRVHFSGNVPDVTIGEAQTVTLDMAFDKAVMRGAAFNVVLPQGLTLVDHSAKLGSLLDNHKVNVKGNLFTVNLKDYGEDDAFTANNGSLCTFDVVADETFVDGSEIKVSNFRCWAAGGHTEYYGEDFAIQVKKSVSAGIHGVSADGQDADAVYQLNGVRTDRMQRGVNIVVKNGKAVKVVKK